MAAARTSLKKVKAYINEYIAMLESEGLAIERVFLFGSYAKGRSHQWSDIDVCVISPRFSKRCDPYEYLWTKRRDDDVIKGIAPVGFNPKGFVDEDPLAWEIKRTGIEIWPVGNRRTSPHTKRRNLRAYPKTSLRLSWMPDKSARA